jgi:hypothetical protein
MNGYSTSLNYQPEILAKINFLIAEIKRIREELEALKLVVVLPPRPSSPLRRHETYASMEQN